MDKLCTCMNFDLIDRAARRCMKIRARLQCLLLQRTYVRVTIEEDVQLSARIELLSGSLWRARTCCPVTHNSFGQLLHAYIYRLYSPRPWNEFDQRDDHFNGQQTVISLIKGDLLVCIAESVDVGMSFASHDKR